MRGDGMREDTNGRTTRYDPLWMSFALVAAIRNIMPTPTIVPVRSYAGETEQAALARLGLPADLPKSEVQFLHLP